MKYFINTLTKQCNCHCNVKKTSLLFGYLVEGDKKYKSHMERERNGEKNSDPTGSKDLGEIRFVVNIPRQERFSHDKW